MGKFDDPREQPDYDDIDITDLDQPDWMYQLRAHPKCIDCYGDGYVVTNGIARRCECLTAHKEWD